MSTPTIVTTQADLDQALADGAPTIHIDSPRGVWLTVGDTRDSDVTVLGETYVDALSGRVGEVTGSGRVGRVTDSGRVGRVTGSGRVGWVTGSGRVGEVTGSGRVGEVTGSGRVGRVTGSGRVGEVTGSGRVGEVTGSGSVGEVTGSGRVERAAGTAVVHLHGTSSLGQAGSHVAVYLHSATATYQGGQLIDLTELDLTDPATWCGYHAVEVVDGVATVYKAVGDDLRSRRGFAYLIGETVTCTDWRPDGECGHGLHFSPSPREAKDYDRDATRFLECRVQLADMRPLDGGTAKLKAPSALVVREVDEHARPIATAPVAA